MIKETYTLSTIACDDRRCGMEIFPKIEQNPVKFVSETAKIVGNIFTLDLTN